MENSLPNLNKTSEYESSNNKNSDIEYSDNQNPDNREVNLQVESPKSIDGFHDLLTHHYSLPIFYDSLRREISFASREGHKIALVKFLLPPKVKLDQLLFFANELEQVVRHHDLIARIADREFAVLLRFDFDITEACQALIRRVENVERRAFQYVWAITDGSKGVEELLKELENPQSLISAHSK